LVTNTIINPVIRVGELFPRSKDFRFALSIIAKLNPEPFEMLFIHIRDSSKGLAETSTKTYLLRRKDVTKNIKLVSR
jgi:hypothetical protein